jgi:hypothetical protein
VKPSIKLLREQLYFLRVEMALRRQQQEIVNELNLGHNSPAKKKVPDFKFQSNKE